MNNTLLAPMQRASRALYVEVSNIFVVFVFAPLGPRGSGMRLARFCALWLLSNVARAGSVAARADASSLYNERSHSYNFVRAHASCVSLCGLSGCSMSVFAVLWQQSPAPRSSKPRNLAHSLAMAESMDGSAAVARFESAVWLPPECDNAL